MNLSLKNRVFLSFGLTIGLILTLCFLVFHFLNSLKHEFKLINRKLLITEVRVSASGILRNHRIMLASRDSSIRSSIGEDILETCSSLDFKLNKLKDICKDQKVKESLTQIPNDDLLQRILSSKENFTCKDITQNAPFTNDSVDQTLETYSVCSNIRLDENPKDETDGSVTAKALRTLSISLRNKYEEVVKEISKTMMITLIIGVLGTIILGLILPSKIALPFKKIKDVIRELQNCNFDVNIYYNKDDEIGEIAREMNIMINSIKSFEERRSNKISVENRKFAALANMVKKPILVANAEGALIYMNNPLYALLQCQSEEVLGRPMKETVIPKSIIHCYELAIKRRSKIENEEVIISKRTEEAIDNGEKKEDMDDTSTYFSKGANEEIKTNKAKKEHNAQEEKEGETLFQGYANVIPIRGKESSLDYYLMILSRKVIT